MTERVRLTVEMREVAMSERVLISGTDRKGERPDAHWVNGTCPCCGEVTVSNAWYVGGRGYILKTHCWNALGEAPTCNYSRVI